MAKRTQAFVLANSRQGSFIVSRLDRSTSPSGNSFGIGYQILENGAYDAEEVNLLLQLAQLLKRVRYVKGGPPLIFVDCGANIGVHTVSLAEMSSEWAHVIAFEAQTRIFYALAGNVALRNCFNAQVFNAAVSDAPGEMAVPALDFEKPASYGSLELLQDSRSEKIGQDIDPHKMIKVPKVTLDGLRIPRLDLLKMDVEGMEGQVVKGAAGLIKKYRPVIQMEMIKDRFGGKELLLQMGYKEYAMAMNSLFVHSDDPVAKYIKVGAPEQRSLRDQARPGR